MNDTLTLQQLVDRLQALLKTQSPHTPTGVHEVSVWDHPIRVVVLDDKREDLEDQIESLKSEIKDLEEEVRVLRIRDENR